MQGIQLDLFSLTQGVHTQALLDEGVIQLSTLSLFSGIGGFELAAEAVGGFNVRQLVELNPDAQKVLAHHFPGIPIHADIRNYYATERFDCVWGGFPCTGTSSAGKREGLSNEESALWWEYLRVIIEAQPRFVVIENPEGFINNGLRTVLASLRMAGYSWDDPQLVSASWLGAPHRRNRLFIVAYPNNLCEVVGERGCRWAEQIGNDIAAIADANSARWQGSAKREVSVGKPSSDSAGLLGERVSNVSRRSWVDDGIPAWLGGIGFDGWWKHNLPPVHPGVPPRITDRRSAISRYGLSVVPQQAMLPLLRVRYLASILTAHGA